MEALLTMSYLVAFFGLMGGIAYGIEALLCAHDRGMARVREYDLQQRANKTNPYLLTTRQEAKR